MNEALAHYRARFDSLSLRERGLIVASVIVLMGYLWWMLFAESVLQETKALEGQNSKIVAEIELLNQTADQIDQRIREGVHKSKEQQLESLRAELKRVNEVLKQKTLELVDPDEMFSLMQNMIFRESQLRLIALSRKSVEPAMQLSEDEAPAIYRHVMSVEFQGGYQDIVKYIKGLEQLEWKLIWDRIHLQTEAYPKINVTIDISTLSESEQWVGL